MSEHDNGWRRNKKTGGWFNIFESNREITAEKGITSELRNMMTEAKIPDLKLKQTSDNKLFSNSLNSAKIENINGWMVDGHLEAEVANYKKFISEDNLAGVAVEENGNITCVFNSGKSKTKGAVQDLILTARENGGTKMDCYGIPLVNMYEKCGFEPVAKVPFDISQAPSDFPKEPDYKAPDYIYFLKKTNKSTKNVIKDLKNNTYQQSSESRLLELPTFEYDEAGKYRDSLL